MPMLNVRSTVRFESRDEHAKAALFQEKRQAGVEAHVAVGPRVQFGYDDNKQSTYALLSH